VVKNDHESPGDFNELEQFRVAGGYSRVRGDPNMPQLPIGAELASSYLK
jgi:hypothetical protein